jgi:cytochrome P450
VISNLRGQLPFKVFEFHRKYGPIVRTAPDELSFTDSRAWNDIYGLQDGRIQNPKDQYAYTPRMPGFERNILLAEDDDVHSRLRRIYGPAFTATAVKEQVGLLTKYSNLLIAQLKIAIEKNPVQDMSAWFNFATFDILGDFAFGEEFHCLDRGGEYHFLVKNTFDGLVIGTQIQQLERYKIWSIVKLFLPKSFMKPKIVMDRYIKELVDRRLEQGYLPGKMDVFNYLLTNKNKEDQLTRPELYENGFTLVAAGSETMASLLSGLTFFLCTNPMVLKKVQQEVRMMFKEDKDITQQSVNELPYMIAVLSESLRIHPGTGFGLPRLIHSKGGQMVAGVWVPEKVRSRFEGALHMLTSTL